MKKVISISAIFFLVISSSFASEKNKNEFRKLLDYTIDSRWDISSSSWIPTSKGIYVYNQEGLLEQSISVDLITGDTLSRAVYFYNNLGKLEEYYFQNYVNKTWTNIRKYDLEYDENGKMKTLVVTDWKNGELVYNRRLTDYTYNEQDLCTFVQYQGWNGSEWINSAQEYYFYNEKDILIRSESFEPDGVRINRVFYETNEINQRSRMLVQNISSDVWYDVYQDIYTYDNCGYNIDFIRQFSVRGIWVNQQKSDYFWRYEVVGDEHRRKIPVCHNGHTIYISGNALKTHLAHGDCIGECAVEKTVENRRNNENCNPEKPFFSIYPNPAKERITIRFERRDDFNIKRIEFTDFYGKLLRSFNISGSEDITIYREGLKSGKYNLRLIGEEVYSAVVIFE